MNTVEFLAGIARALITAVKGGVEIFSLDVEGLIEDLERNPEAVDRELLQALRDMDLDAAEE